MRTDEQLARYAAHNKIRYASDPAYRARKAKMARAYYLAHKAEAAARVKAWQQTNRDLVNYGHRKRYKENLEQSRAKGRIYSKRRRDTGATAEYQRSLPKEARAAFNRRYRAKAIPNLQAWYVMQMLRQRYKIKNPTVEDIENRRTIILTKRSQKMGQLIHTAQILSMKTEEPPAIDQTAKIERFAALVKQGIDAWTQAGEILVSLIDSDPGVINRIVKEHPGITKQMLQAFERIGRKMVYAPILADTSTAARALLELPYEQQKKYFHGSIETVVSIKAGVPVTKLKRIDEMTRSEVKMVFGKGCVHNIDQQAFRLKEIEAFEIQKEKPKPAFVDYKTVEVGYFYVTLDEKGEVSIKKAPVTKNAHSVRLVPYPNGEKSAVVLFYREPRTS